MTTLHGGHARLLRAALTGFLIGSIWAAPAAADTHFISGSSSGSGTGSASLSADGLANLPAASPRALGALQVALWQIGRPYVWGGTDPGGFDCSGLVQWSFRHVGINVPRTTWQQARAGSPVPFFAMMPGDVVVVNPDGSHVGIYAGGGMLLNAHSDGVGVVLTPLNQFHIYAIRRFF
ncbi:MULTISPECIES: C40 family peptidase [Nocardia]|uniref:C40 family peptidase n=1 Tax=Nocardia TaxID=1817 RepID=UPI0027E2835F|nr:MULTISPECIES: NlpC/P60 family protein [Nocardia]